MTGRGRDRKAESEQTEEENGRRRKAGETNIKRFVEVNLGVCVAGVVTGADSSLKVYHSISISISIRIVSRSQSSQSYRADLQLVVARSSSSHPRQTDCSGDVV
jgi:hypothetical protein